MNRILTVNGARFSVPRFIHRKFDHGGCWSIALPGVCAIFTDAEAGSTRAALNQITDLLHGLLKFDAQALLHFCTLKVEGGVTASHQSTAIVTFGNALLDRCLGQPVPLATHDTALLSALYSTGVPFRSAQAKALLGTTAWNNAFEQWVQALRKHVTRDAEQPKAKRKPESPQFQLGFA